MEPGPKALLETQMPVEATAAPGPRGPQPLPLEQRPDPQRSPLKATAGRAGPSGTSPLCSPGWHGRQADARQTPQRVEGYCVSWQVHSLSRSCHSLFLLRAARCILRNVPSRMQCKQCRRKIQLLGQSWDVLGRLLPYTSVAMTHSFLSSDIKHTDWYMDSLGEHIADIRHSGFSLCNLSGAFSPKLLSLWEYFPAMVPRPRGPGARL